MREQCPFFLWWQRIAIDLENAPGERLELLGGNFDHATIVTPLDDREAVGFVLEHDTA
jgi:hypothetical protein